MTQENLSATPAPVRPPAATRYALGALTALLLAWVTVAAYWRAFDCGFVNYDDNQYVYDNEQVTKGLTSDGAKWAFTTTETVNWYPLTWLSLQLDASIWGVKRPFGFHLTNVLLHIADTLLLFWVLTRMTGRLGRSAFVAGLFALHPLHVESVAWVTERKDVLSALFWMLTLAAYVWYAERPQWRRYLLVMLAFALGLLAKSMLVTLPCVLFLLDFWPLRRYPGLVPRDAAAGGPPSGARPAPVSWRRLIVEKLPLFVLSAASTAMTMYAQMKGGESNPLEAMPLRLENALISYATYIGKTIWPVGLAPYYPFPTEVRGGLSPYEAAMAGLLLLAVTVLAAAAARRRPYLIVGWLWFLGTLAPVIGVIQVLGDYAMADRFTYIPLIGLFIAVTWGAAEGLARAGVRPWLSAVAAVALLGAFAAGTWRQVGYWHDSITLWRHTLDVNPKNQLAYNNIGHFRLTEGDDAANRIWEAQRQGLPVSPDEDWLMWAKYAEAEQLFRRAIESDPSFALSHYSLACTLQKECQVNEPDDQPWPNQPSNARRWNGAVAEYLLAAIWEPGSVLYQYQAGWALSTQSRYKEAIPFFQDAVRIEPKYINARLGLGWALFWTGDFDGTVSHCRAALETDPKSAPAHYCLGRALYSRGGGDVDGAIAEFRETVRLDPNHADAHDWLGWTLLKLGDVIEGNQERTEADRLRRQAAQGP